MVAGTDAVVLYLTPVYPDDAEDLEELGMGGPMLNWDRAECGLALSECQKSKGAGSEALYRRCRHGCLG